jgi:hypothetical protein
MVELHPFTILGSGAGAGPAGGHGLEEGPGATVAAFLFFSLDQKTVIVIAHAKKPAAKKTIKIVVGSDI